MPDVVLRRVFRAPLIQEAQHLLFDRGGIVSSGDNIVLMKQVAEEMPVIDFMDDSPVQLRRQQLYPGCRVSGKSDVESDDVLDAIGMDGAISDCRARDGEPEKERFM